MKLEDLLGRASIQDTASLNKLARELYRLGYGVSQIDLLEHYKGDPETDLIKGITINKKTRVYHIHRERQIDRGYYSAQEYLCGPPYSAHERELSAEEFQNLSNAKICKTCKRNFERHVRGL